jgi:flagellar biosynthesis chaperone FliJ
MPKFKFKFETISKIKDRLRVKVQKEIAEFNLKIEQKRILIDYYERHDIHLRSKLKKFEAELRSLEYHKRIKMEDLVEKTKELKMFELLEEKHYTNYLLDQSKSENSMLDELAIQKIGRK